MAPANDNEEDRLTVARMIWSPIAPKSFKHATIINDGTRPLTSAEVLPPSIFSGDRIVAATVALAAESVCGRPAACARELFPSAAVIPRILAG